MPAPEPMVNVRLACEHIVEIRRASGIYRAHIGNDHWRRIRECDCFIWCDTCNDIQRVSFK